MICLEAEGRENLLPPIRDLVTNNHIFVSGIRIWNSFISSDL